ncbi:ATP-binding cassette domain-containing protein [Marinomonas rhizomae]|uniref:Phospholipid/cholesterol/gamma-HCH transport system ATP-binding protein n=1 Tax=Marinomonas rhizomae TaxID=491948 RepID=A0A366J163_9GAMM|nr:phospholipid/cholesterol/gamma-HCH transport system ATP-binding protein [Marinomonas rhizomae]RNF71818.1 ATP-binding cassette domain-containing protein [Marinomonas rhizomae]
MSVVDAYIKVQDVSFFRGDRVIYEDVSLSIPRGKITAVMGPSGTGKTTLLRLIAAQLAPDSGTVLVDGQNVHSLSRSELYKVRKKMGMLFQSGALFSDMSVAENIAFPMEEHTQLDAKAIADIVADKLYSVGLRGAADLMPSELSGGMARRVALARAIALDPELVMYDEPFTGQDPISKGVLVKLIRQLNDTANMTSVLVSHDVEESLSIADHVCILAGGRVIAEGAADDIRASNDPEVKQFLNGEPDGPVPFHYPEDDNSDRVAL